MAAVFDILGWDTEDLAEPTTLMLQELFRTQWFRYLAFLTMGIGIGIWMHWCATKFAKPKEKQLTIAENKTSKSASRSLSFEQKKKLATLLHDISIPKNYISVIPTASTKEATNFATDIIEAIKMSGVNSGFDIIMWNGDLSLTGIQIVANGPIQNWTREISAALKEIGLENKIKNVNRERSPGSVFIQIGWLE